MADEIGTAPVPDIVLKCGEILLRGGKVARLKVLAELLEILGKWGLGGAELWGTDDAAWDCRNRHRCTSM